MLILISFSIKQYEAYSFKKKIDAVTAHFCKMQIIYVVLSIKFIQDALYSLSRFNELG